MFAKKTSKHEKKTLNSVRQQMWCNFVSNKKYQSTYLSIIYHIRYHIYTNKDFDSIFDQNFNKMDLSSIQNIENC